MYITPTDILSDLYDSILFIAYFLVLLLLLVSFASSPLVVLPKNLFMIVVDPGITHFADPQ